jgi:acetyl-CoA synthetase
MAPAIMYGLKDQTVRDARTYDEARARHRWRVPGRYNIAWDVCDRHAGGQDRRALVRDAGGRPARTYTFDELKRLSDRLASALGGTGIERGDRVALMLPQTPEHLVAHLAVFKLGAVSVPLSRLFGPDALRYRLSDSGAAILLTDGENVAKALAVAPELPSLRHVVLCDDDDGGGGERRRGDGGVRDVPVLAFRELMDRGSDGLRAVDTAADDPAILIYTSGTTGPPKGALHAHRYLLGYNGVDYANNFFREADVYWSPADWAWVGGLLVGLFCPLAHGVPVVASAGRFDPVGAFELMERHGVTNTLLSATALRQIAARVDEPRRYRLGLRCVLSGGEKVTPEIARWTQERLGLPINEVYGQTEANIIVGENDPLIPPRREPLGRPYPGHDVAVVDDAGRLLGAGELGVIAVRRGDPVIMLRYWNRPEATAAAWRGDWFLTGDLGTLDADGFVHYKGRVDDVINSAGFRIGPAEVEACLLEHEAVEQCAVVGVPDETRGEAVKAYVKLAPGQARSPALADALVQHVKTRLGPFQRPREIEWADELPMTVSGKIRRAELRTRAGAAPAAAASTPSAAPTDAWGRRLSDALRAALDAGDLVRARALAAEGDGQARSLDKEYALMYRGLGITIRVLLHLLGEQPPRAALVRLLARFRADMLDLMARAYPEPEPQAELARLRARVGIDGVATGAAAPGWLAGEPSAARVGEEIERTRELVAGAEELFAREQARLARQVLAALDAGDPAGARRGVDDKERGQYLPLHDRIVRFMAETFAYVLRELGPDALLRFQLATAEGQRDGFERWDRMSAAEFARATAFLLKQHMGQVAVHEDDEKFTVVQTPCGSGGRLRLAGAYDGADALPFVEATEAFPPGALTHGEARFPVYCSHCPIWNGLAPVEWFGRPHWVFDDPSRADGSCTLHVYKRRDGAPRAYLARLGRGEASR